MEREILFRAKSKDLNLMVHGFYFYSELEDKHYIIGESKDYGFQKIEISPNTLGRYTGLNDKNGARIFEGDILEIKNYEYSERHCNGYYTRRTDLRFTIHQGLLETEYKLVSPPETLTHITLSVIFNLVNPKTGNRLYVDSLRQRIEVIGNIHEKNN